MPLELSFHNDTITAHLDDGEGGLATIPLDPGRVERQLHDIEMFFACASRRISPALSRHLENHFSRNAHADATCHFCKLQGRILAAQGRHRPSDPGDSRRAPHIGGTTQIRRIPLEGPPRSLAKRYREAGLRLPPDLATPCRPGLTGTALTLDVTFPDEE